MRMLPRREYQSARKINFLMTLQVTGILQNPGEMIFSLEDFNKHIGRRIVGFEGVHGGYGIGERRKSCTCVLWILRRHLIEFPERW